MKILHTADWHIGQFKGPVVDGVNLRSQDTVKCLEYMVQVAIEEKPDIVCVSGDIFHQEQVGPVRYSDEMITATNIITSLAHFSKYVIVMRGTPNHDGAAQFRVLERMLLNIRNVDVVTARRKMNKFLKLVKHHVAARIKFVRSVISAYGWFKNTNMVKYRIRNKVDELMRIARKIASDHDKGNGYVEEKYFNMWRRYYAQGSKSRKNGKGSVQGKTEWRSRCVAQEQPA